MEADEILLGQHGMFLNVRFLGAELAVLGTVLSVASEKLASSYYARLMSVTFVTPTIEKRPRN